MQNLVCLLVGHNINPEHYGHVEPGATDGLGTQHASVTATCWRCWNPVELIQIHLPKVPVMRAITAYVPVE